MKGFVTIVAASALLSASLVAGLAASDQARPKKPEAAGTDTATVQLSRTATRTLPAPKADSTATWVDPPATSGCRGSAWPYRTTLCVSDDGANSSARKVRVIPTDGGGDGRSRRPGAVASR